MWLDLVRYGWIWFDLNYFDFSLIMVWFWFDLVFFGLIWFDLVRFGFIWFGLVYFDFICFFCNGLV
jgi:hypothetical protein